MPNQRLTYVVAVDSSGAVSSLDQIGRAGSDAARDIADGFDKAGTASENAIKAMTATMDTLEADAAAAAKAVAAIGEHLTVDVDSSTLNRFVTDLKSKFGVAFDAVEADAKEFADVLSRGVDMSKTTAEIRGVGDALDHTRDGADQSRSVLANMAGNAAQDLGELGGVVGTLGVGIGQLAEYATEGNISLTSLAKVAGPMAGLAAATLLVQSAMQAVAAEKKFDEAQVSDFFQAMREGQTVIEHIRDTIQETGRLDVETGLFGGGGLLGLTSKTQNLIPLFNELGLSYKDFARLLAAPDGVQQLEAMKDEFLVLMEAADNDALADNYEAQAIAARDAAAGLADYKENTNDAAVALAEWAKFIGTGSIGIADINSAMLGLSNTALQTSHNWGIILNDLADGRLDTDAARESWNILAGALGVTNDEMAEMAQSKLDEKMAAQATSADATAAAYAELAAESEATADAMADLSATMKSADFNAAGIAAAGDALADWFNTTAAGGTSENVIFAYQDALDAFAANVEENSGIVQGALSGMFTTKGPEARAQLELLEQLGETIMPQITEAFDDADGSFDQFSRSVSVISDNLHRDLVAALIESGVSAADAEDQANSLQMSLGLIPSNVETMFRLQGDADAKAKLALLQGSMDLLSEGAQAEVAMHILADDPQAALAAMQADIDAQNLAASMRLNTAPAFNDYYALAGVVDNALTVPVFLNVMNRAILGGIAAGGGFRSTVPAGLAAAPAAAVEPATTTTASSSATVTLARPAVTVNITAGVIGGRYDVERAVTGALRDAARLGRI